MTNGSPSHGTWRTSSQRRTSNRGGSGSGSGTGPPSSYGPPGPAEPHAAFERNDGGGLGNNSNSGGSWSFAPRRRSPPHRRFRGYRGGASNSGYRNAGSFRSFQRSPRSPPRVWRSSSQEHGRNYSPPPRTWDRAPPPLSSHIHPSRQLHTPIAQRAGPRAPFFGSQMRSRHRERDHPNLNLPLSATIARKRQPPTARSVPRSPPPHTTPSPRHASIHYNDSLGQRTSLGFGEASRRKNTSLDMFPKDRGWLDDVSPPRGPSASNSQVGDLRNTLSRSSADKRRDDVRRRHMSSPRNSTARGDSPTREKLDRSPAPSPSTPYLRQRRNHGQRDASRRVRSFSPRDRNRRPVEEVRKFSPQTVPRFRQFSPGIVNERGRDAEPTKDLKQPSSSDDIIRRNIETERRTLTYEPESDDMLNPEPAEPRKARTVPRMEGATESGPVPEAQSKVLDSNSLKLSGNVCMRAASPSADLKLRSDEIFESAVASVAHGRNKEFSGMNEKDGTVEKSGEKTGSSLHAARTCGKVPEQPTAAYSNANFSNCLSNAPSLSGNLSELSVKKADARKVTSDLAESKHYAQPEMKSPVSTGAHPKNTDGEVSGKETKTLACIESGYVARSKETAPTHEDELLPNSHDNQTGLREISTESSLVDRKKEVEVKEEELTPMKTPIAENPRTEARKQTYDDKVEVPSAEQKNRIEETRVAVREPMEPISSRNKDMNLAKKPTEVKKQLCMSRRYSPHSLNAEENRSFPQSLNEISELPSSSEPEKQIVNATDGNHASFKFELESAKALAPVHLGRTRSGILNGAFSEVELLSKTRDSSQLADNLNSAASRLPTTKSHQTLLSEIAKVDVQIKNVRNRLDLARSHTTSLLPKKRRNEKVESNRENRVIKFSRRMCQRVVRDIEQRDQSQSGLLPKPLTHLEYPNDTLEKILESNRARAKSASMELSQYCHRPEAGLFLDGPAPKAEKVDISSEAIAAVTKIVRFGTAERIKHQRRLAREYKSLKRAWQHKLKSNRDKRSKEKREIMKDRDRFLVMHTRGSSGAVSCKTSSGRTSTKVLPNVTAGGMLSSTADIDAMLADIESAGGTPGNREIWTRTLAEVPPQNANLVPVDTNNLLMNDPVAEIHAARAVNFWTQQERLIFLVKYLTHSKNFRKIAAALKNKTTQDCVRFYFDYKLQYNLKQLHRDSASLKRKGIRELTLLNIVGMPPTCENLALCGIDPATSSGISDASVNNTTPINNKRPSILSGRKTTPKDRAFSQMQFDSGSSPSSSDLSKDERRVLCEALANYGFNWKVIAESYPILGRSPLTLEIYYSKVKAEPDFMKCIEKYDFRATTLRVETENIIHHSNNLGLGYPVSDVPCSKRSRGPLPSSSKVPKSSTSNKDQTLSPKSAAPERPKAQWNPEECEKVERLFKRFGKDFKQVATLIGTKTAAQCKGYWKMLNQRGDSRRRNKSSSTQNKNDRKRDAEDADLPEPTHSAKKQAGDHTRNGRR